ncbi:hypothetical protein JST97_28395 [bacterium]|nr:hypothetical protein [bacterium]
MTAKEQTTARELDLAEQLMAKLTKKNNAVLCLQIQAVAVENDLQLATQRREAGFLKRARERVEWVHQSLARHREDAPLRGWLSGLDDCEARLHPTRGGLRSGAPYPERGPRQPLEPHKEPLRDGQCFRDLALWMAALERCFRVSGLPQYLDWAEDLAEVAFQAFVYRTPAGPRMHSKMSCDLNRALIPEMDPLDPLDGLATYLRLHSTGGSLEEECYDFAQMIAGAEFSSREPGDLGRILWNSARLRNEPDLASLSDGLVALAVRCLAWFVHNLPLQEERANREPAGELVLAYGLDRVRSELVGRRACRPYARLASQILAHWSRESNRQLSIWTDQSELHDVLLAGALLSRHSNRS